MWSHLTSLCFHIPLLHADQRQHPLREHLIPWTPTLECTSTHQVNTLDRTMTTLCGTRLRVLNQSGLFSYIWLVYKTALRVGRYTFYFGIYVGSDMFNARRQYSIRTNPKNLSLRLWCEGLLCYIGNIQHVHIWCKFPHHCVIIGMETNACCMKDRLLERVRSTSSGQTWCLSISLTPSNEMNPALILLIQLSKCIVREISQILPG
jgi:hypothetical protein